MRLQQPRHALGSCVPEFPFATTCLTVRPDRACCAALDVTDHAWVPYWMVYWHPHEHLSTFAGLHVVHFLCVRDPRLGEALPYLLRAGYLRVAFVLLVCHREIC